jgi:phage tail-like protein
MAIGDRSKDPYLAFRFLVEIKGLPVGGFSEVSGLQAEIEVKEYQEGGQNNYIHKLAGPVRYPSNLVLKHGLTTDETLWNWYQKVMQGTIERRNGSIVLLDSAGEEKWRWNFSEAYPVKWTGPDLKANNSAVAIESIELAHHGIKKG